MVQQKKPEMQKKKEKYKERVAVYKKSLELAKLMQLSAMEPKAIKILSKAFIISQHLRCPVIS